MVELCRFRPCWQDLTAPRTHDPPGSRRVRTGTFLFVCEFVPVATRASCRLPSHRSRIERLETSKADGAFGPSHSIYNIHTSADALAHAPSLPNADESSLGPADASPNANAGACRFLHTFWLPGNSDMPGLGRIRFRKGTWPPMLLHTEVSQLDLGCLDERKSPQKLSESHEWHHPTDRQVDASDAIVCALSCRGANTAPENAPQTHTPRQTQNAERRTRTTSELQPTAATVRLDLDLFDIVL